MLAIIPEDSKAGKQFWHAVNRELFEGKALMVDQLRSDTDALGFTSILPRLRKAINEGRITSGWSVVIAIDYTGTLAVERQLTFIKKLCAEHKIHMYITTYHCIEEIFLSFDLLPTWVNNIESQYIDFISYVHNCIKTGVNYFTHYADYKDIFKKVLDSCKKDKNREQFAAQLLLAVTQKNSGFKISKGQLGACWVNNCCETEKNTLSRTETKIKQYHKLCGIPNDQLTAQMKLKLICEKSVLNTKAIKLAGLVGLLEK